MVALKSASSALLTILLSHCNKLMVFCSVVGVVNLVIIVSNDSGYWSSANKIESLDCFSCGSECIDCSNDRICLAFNSAAMISFGVIQVCGDT